LGAGQLLGRHRPRPRRLSELRIQAFLFANLLPVTIENMIGGALMVGVVYWFVYLRGDRRGGSEASHDAHIMS
jgi:hypothetical protein